GLWYMVYGLWSTVYRLWSMVYGLWSMVYGLWSMVYGLWSMVHGLLSMVYPRLFFKVRSGAAAVREPRRALAARRVSHSAGCGLGRPGRQRMDGMIKIQYRGMLTQNDSFSER